MTELLVLSRADIEGLLTMEDAVKAMEDVFAASCRGMAESSGVMFVDVPQFGGDWSVKPGYLIDKKYLAVKLGCGYRGNAAKGIPTHIATIILSDATNGLPLAVLDGVYITTVRTGATGAVAAKYLARKDSQNIGIVGTGTQGRIQLSGLKSLFDIKEVRAYDVNSASGAAYAKEMSSALGVPVTAVDAPEAAARNADILVTVTPSRTPYIRNEWVSNGTHINAFGADRPGKQELDGMVYRRGKLVTDKREVAIQKKIFDSADIYAELGEVIVGTKKGRESPEEVTVFDSTGLGIQDAAAAALAYEKAKAAGIGTRIDFS